VLVLVVRACLALLLQGLKRPILFCGSKLPIPKRNDKRANEWKMRCRKQDNVIVYIWKSHSFKRPNTPEFQAGMHGAHQCDRPTETTSAGVDWILLAEASGKLGFLAYACLCDRSHVCCCCRTNDDGQNCVYRACVAGSGRAAQTDGLVVHNLPS
jgi:hypothetical protein